MDTAEEKVFVGSKRKISKEKRFRQNVKGFIKQGNFGRGSYLEEEQAKYFLNILDVLKEDFDSAEDKENLANNVLSQTEEKEGLFATNQIASKVVESLIGFASIEKFERYQAVFGEDIRTYSQDKFSSHVLQKMVFIAALRSNPTTETPHREMDLLNERNYNLTRQVPEEHRQKCQMFVTRISKFLLNNLEEIVGDQYANHVIRTCLLSLAGIQDEHVIATVAQGQQLKTQTTRDEWKELVEEFANRLRAWPQFVDFPYDGIRSGLLQTLICSLRVVNKDLLKSVGGTLLTDSLSTPDESQATQIRAFSTEFSIRLLETLIVLAGQKLLSKVICTLFVGRVRQLAELKCANFAVQKLFDNVKEKSEFETLFGEIQDHFESILKVGHTGVILAMAKASQRLNAKQMPFIKSLKTALNVAAGQTAEFIVAVLKLRRVELCQDTNNYINIHGSVIMQTMLGFQKPIEVINALIGCDNQILLPLLMTTKGSYIVDEFFKAQFVGEKSKIKFIRKFEGYYLELALNKAGSRILESIYEAGDTTQRTRIVQELSEKQNQLEGVHSGFIISKKFNVGVYKQNPNRWQAKAVSSNSTQKLFKGIV